MIEFLAGVAVGVGSTVSVLSIYAAYKIGKSKDEANEILRSLGLDPNKPLNSQSLQQFFANMQKRTEELKKKAESFNSEGFKEGTSHE